jgi:IS66 Orf2 like protein
MRRGFLGLALLVQKTLKADPHAGHLFVFRGKRGDLVKIIWHNGQGACLFSKRLERGCLRGWHLVLRPHHQPRQIRRTNDMDFGDVLKQGERVRHTVKTLPDDLVSARPNSHCIAAIEVAHRCATIPAMA